MCVEITRDGVGPTRGNDALLKGAAHVRHEMSLKLKNTEMLK